MDKTYKQCIVNIRCCYTADAQTATKLRLSVGQLISEKTSLSYHYNLLFHLRSHV